MALGTTPNPQPNPQMPRSAATPSTPATPETVPTGAAPAWATPGAAPHTTEPRDPSQPWLDPDDTKVDWVMLMRCYPNATSKDDLRAAAMAAGAEAAKAAEAARAAKDVPAEEQKAAERPPA